MNVEHGKRFEVSSDTQGTGVDRFKAQLGGEFDSVIKRNDVAKKEVELERLNMAIKDNIITDEVKKNGFGAIVPARLDDAIEQIGLTYKWKSAPPKSGDIFDASFLPDAAARKAM
jgi:NitT/TauT family transport system substrate-binding protein